MQTVTDSWHTQMMGKTMYSTQIPRRFLSLVLLFGLVTHVSIARAQETNEQPGSQQSDSIEITNGDFEELDGDKPIDWELPGPGANNYRFSVDKGNAASGEACILIDSTESSTLMGFAALNRLLDPTPYRGKRIRYRAAVRVESTKKGRAQMWLRCDAKNEDGETVMQALDNMQNRPIKDSQWQHYEIVADVLEDTENVLIGVLVIGQAKVWFDDVSVEVVGNDVKTTTLYGGDSDATQSFWTWWMLPAVIALILFGYGLCGGQTSDGELVQLNGTQRFAFRFTLIYWLLYFFPSPIDSILAPFGINILSNSNEWLGKAVSWTGSYVFGLDVGYEINGSGDTTYDFVRIFTFFLIAIIVAGLWSLLDRRRRKYVWLKDGFHSYLRYALAIVMMGYGLAKMGEVMNQFQIPNNQQLSQRFGESSPMGLLWKFMGASRPYTYFAGLGEVVAGCLLVWRRTSILGAMVAIGVMTNVVMLNFCYDVPVKLFSFHLLVVAFLVLAPDIKRLVNVMLLNRVALRRELKPPYVGPNTVWLHRLVKLTLVGLFIAFPIYTHLKTELADQKTPPAFFGVYLVDEFRVEGDLTPEDQQTEERWKSVDIKRYPFAMNGDDNDSTTDMLRVLTTDGERVGGVFELNDSQSEFNLSEPMGNFPTKLAVKIVDEDRIQLSGQTDKGKLFVKLRRDDQTYLLMERGFRWINESPYNR
jgi:hypothetical protein